jgi:hypothetical protein
LPSRLQKALPAGISVLDATSMDDAEPALQVQIRSAEYEVSLVEGSEALELQAAIERVLAASNLPRERRGKAYDLRPLIEQLSMVPGSRTVIFMQLAAREGATGRPEEVLAELGIPSNSTRIERTRLIFQ